MVKGGFMLDDLSLPIRDPGPDEKAVHREAYSRNRSAGLKLTDHCFKF